VKQNNMTNQAIKRAMRARLSSKFGAHRMGVGFAGVKGG
jgi:hypothetical protein